MTTLLERPVTTTEPAAAQPYRRRERTIRVLAYAAMVVALLVVALPLYWIVVTSFKQRPDIYTLPVTWWPSVFHPRNYTEAVTSVPFGTFLRNSLIITTVLSSVSLSSAS